ncbi:unnamed protein product, partial [Symbiodinium sp. CCMP2456]
ESAEESSVLSCEKAANAKDQVFLQESLQETATGSSRAEDCRRPANCTLRKRFTSCTMLSFKEGSDSVPMPLNHLPGSTPHAGVDLHGKTTEQHRMEDEDSIQETAVGSSREEDRPQLADYTFCRVSLRAPDVAPVLEAAEESSMLSSEEVLHPADQEEPDSVPTPLNQFPESLDRTLHTGVNLLSSSFLPF